MIGCDGVIVESLCDKEPFGKKGIGLTDPGAGPGRRGMDRGTSVKR